MKEEENENYVSERYESMADNYNSLLLRLDPTPTINEIKRFLLRQVQYNKDKEEYERPGNMKPMLAEEGVNEIILELKSRMSVDKVLAKLQNNELKTIVREVGETIMEFIWFKSEEYDINESNYTSLYNCVIHNISIFLSRALSGSENQLLVQGLATREVISRYGQQNIEQPKQRGFSWLGNQQRGMR